MDVDGQSCDSGRECRSRLDEMAEMRAVIAHLLVGAPWSRPAHPAETPDVAARAGCDICKRAFEIARPYLGGWR